MGTRLDKHSRLRLNPCRVDIEQHRKGVDKRIPLKRGATFFQAIVSDGLISQVRGKGLAVDQRHSHSVDGDDT